MRYKIIWFDIDDISVLLAEIQLIVLILIP